MTENLQRLGEDFLRVKAEYDSVNFELAKVRSNKPFLFGKEKYAERLRQSQEDMEKIQISFNSAKDKLDSVLIEHYQGVRLVLAKMTEASLNPEHFMRLNNEVANLLHLAKEYDFDKKRNLAELLIWKWILFEFGDRDKNFEFGDRNKLPNLEELWKNSFLETEALEDFNTKDPLINIALGYFNLKLGIAMQKTGQPAIHVKTSLERAFKRLELISWITEKPMNLDLKAFAGKYYTRARDEMTVTELDDFLKKWNAILGPIFTKGYSK